MEDDGGDQAMPDVTPLPLLTPTVGAPEIVARINSQSQGLHSIAMGTNERFRRIEGQLASILGALERLNLPNSTTSQNSTPLGSTSADTSSSDGINKHYESQLSKKAYRFQEDQKLQGSENYEDWKLAIDIVFRTLNLPRFFENPNVIADANDSTKALILMVLRDSLASTPRGLVNWLTDPIAVISALKANYAPTAPIRRDQLTREFYTLEFGAHKDLYAFNAYYLSLLAKLEAIGVRVAEEDKINRYFQVLGPIYGEWVRRMQSTQRGLRNSLGLGQTITLTFLIDDLVAETKAKEPAAYANPIRDLHSQKKDKSKTKRNKWSKNEAKDAKPNSTSSKGKGPKEKVNQKARNSAEFRNEGDMACFTELDPYLSDSDDDDTYPTGSSVFDEVHLSGGRAKTLRSSPNWPNKNGLLYDTGSTVHIVNNRNAFRDFNPHPIQKRVYTGGGPLTPKGIGTAEFSVLTQESPVRHATLTLKNALYIPEFPVNIISGALFYKAGGWLNKQTLYNSRGVTTALLDWRFNIKLRTQPNSVRVKPKELGAGDEMGLGASCDWASFYSDTIDLEELNSRSIEGPSPNPSPTGVLPPSKEQLVAKALVWHNRLGHISPKLLKKTAKITKGVPDFDSLGEKDLICEACIRAISVRRPSKRAIGGDYKPLDRLDGDTFKVSPRPFDNRPIQLVLVDRASRFRWVLPLRNRGAEEVLLALKSLFRTLKHEFGKYPSQLHYDGGTEISNSKVADWLSRKGIKFTTSSPYTPEQNGLSERSIRVLVDRLRSTILASNLPLYLWNFLLPYTVSLVNSTALTNRDETPYQAFYGFFKPSAPSIPDLSKARIIGSKCHLLIPKEKRTTSHKLDARTEEGRLLAVLGTNTYLVYVPKRHSVVKSSFVKLFETVPPKGIEPIGGVDSLRNDVTHDVNPPRPLKDIGHMPIGDTTHNEQSDSTVRQPSPIVEADSSASKPASLDPIEVALPKPRIDPSEYQPISDDEVDPMDLDEPINALIQSFCYAIADEDEPKSVLAALKRLDGPKWAKAYSSELAQLFNRNTFYFTSYKALKRRPISTKWVAKVKRDQLGSIIKYKARLVVRGFEQRQGIDYIDTFASTSIPPTWRIILALAAINDWEVEQIDFVGAFLNGVLEEDLAITLPPGLEALIQYDADLRKLVERFGYDPREKQALRLVKALYGLKQSPRVWQQRLVQLLRTLGFRPLVSDTAVFYDAKSRIYVVSYVDDCLFIGPNIRAINALKNAVSRAYEIEDRGPASYFLGVEIIRDRGARKIWLSQKRYIETALAHFHMQDAKEAPIPLKPGILGLNQPSKPVDQPEHKEFQSIVGTTMYAMLLTRLDIAFPVQYLSRHLVGPSKQHLGAAKDLLRYLKGTINLALCLGGASNNAMPKAVCDSDFAGDQVSAKSTYGYITYIGGSPISWKSKRASTISLSTLEAEFDAICEVTREILWIRNLYKELNLPLLGPTPLASDSQNAISTAKDPKNHARTKHTLVKYAFVRQEVLEGTIAISYLDTSSMPADGLTKPLPAPKFRDFLGLLGLENPRRY